MNCVTTSKRRKHCAHARVKERWDPVALSLSLLGSPIMKTSRIFLCYIEMQVTAKAKNGPWSQSSLFCCCYFLRGGEKKKRFLIRIRLISAVFLEAHSPNTCLQRGREREWGRIYSDCKGRSGAPTSIMLNYGPLHGLNAVLSRVMDSILYKPLWSMK